MRRWLFLLLLCLAPSSAQQVSTAARQKDLDWVANQLPALHPNFFFQLDPAQFRQAVDALSARISTASDAEFYVGLTRLVAMAGDGHTTIYLYGRPSAAI